MEKSNEELNSIVQSSSMLLSFEGWIKYIEGFSRGLQTTKTVDAITVFDCVGEIMEYMKTLKTQIFDLLMHCEEVLEDAEGKDEIIKQKDDEIAQLKQQLAQYENKEEKEDEDGEMQEL